MLRNADGTFSCDMRYAGYKIREGKYALEGLPAVYADAGEAQTLEVYLEDPVTKVMVMLLYGVLPEYDIITRSVRIFNRGSREVCIEKAASASLDFVYGKFDLITFYGRHAMERNFQRTPVSHGGHTIGSRRGTSSHQYNPTLILAEEKAGEDSGSCYGMAFVYSGNFRGEAEKDQFNQTRVMMGLESGMFRYPLKTGGDVHCAGDGHELFRGRLSEAEPQLSRVLPASFMPGESKEAVRPILVNSWEAAYFNFTGETIVNLAEEAAELGIEMVVLDDGWFGKRDDDNSRLGDWKVDENLGCSMGELARKVNEKGLKFGLWIEPEMISEDSDLYRAHPDWVFADSGQTAGAGEEPAGAGFFKERGRGMIFSRKSARSWIMPI